MVRIHKIDARRPKYRSKLISTSWSWKGKPASDWYAGDWGEYSFRWMIDTKRKKANNYDEDDID